MYPWPRMLSENVNEPNLTSEWSRILLVAYPGEQDSWRVKQAASTHFELFFCLSIYHAVSSRSINWNTSYTERLLPYLWGFCVSTQLGLKYFRNRETGDNEEYSMIDFCLTSTIVVLDYTSPSVEPKPKLQVVVLDYTSPSVEPKPKLQVVVLDYTSPSVEPKPKLQVQDLQNPRTYTPRALSESHILYDSRWDPIMRCELHYYISRELLLLINIVSWIYYACIT